MNVSLKDLLGLGMGERADPDESLLSLWQRHTSRNLEKININYTKLTVKTYRHLGFFRNGFFDS
jgi:hypothetical protein